MTIDEAKNHMNYFSHVRSVFTGRSEPMLRHRDLFLNLFLFFLNFSSTSIYMYIIEEKNENPGKCVWFARLIALTNSLVMQPS